MDINIPQTIAQDVVLPTDKTETADHHEKINKQIPKPVATADRIQTVDLIRGFALLGILLMNIPIFGKDPSVFNTVLRGSQNSTDYLTMSIIYSFFDGTMRGLFSMLFGAGMILFTMNKKETPGGVSIAEYYYRRLLWLVLFGVINAFVFLWEGDILFYYGLFGMLLYPFRKMQPKWLVVIGVACIGIGIFKGLLWYNETREKRASYVDAVAAQKANKKLTDKQQEAIATWTAIENNQKPDPENISRNIRKMHSDYGTIFGYLIPRNAGNETWGTYHGIWDMLSMMFIGMALFGLGFFSNRLSTSTYGMTLLVGYGVGIPLGWIFFKNAYVGSLNFSAYVDAFRVPHWALYDLRRLLLVLGHASLLMLVFRSRIVPWLMKGLANVGQMAFTNYLMQSLICTLIFFGYGLNHYDNLKFHQLYYVVAGVWIFQIIFSAIWLRYFRFGPFEWAWRSLTYWQKQPMRKTEKTEV